MEKKKNCWEALNCGREPGGRNAAELGVCPASTDQRVDGVHSGKNGGRCCWALVGTLCGGKVQGTFATKQLNCLNCRFYKSVKQEEGINFVLVSEITSKLKKTS